MVLVNAAGFVFLAALIASLWQVRTMRGRISRLRRRAKVRLGMRPNDVDLHVEDDGAGFDPDAGPAGRMGLRIMRERAAAIGAHLLIDSAPGEGARISVTWRGAVESGAPAEGADGSHERGGAAVDAAPVIAEGKRRE